MAYKPDKHGRDHCPGGEDPIPCLTSSSWAILAVPDGQSVLDDSLTPITDYGRSESFGTALTVDPVTGIITIVEGEEGIYDIHSWAEFDNETAIMEGPVFQAGQDFQDISYGLMAHIDTPGNVDATIKQHKTTLFAADLPQSVNLQVAQFSGGADDFINGGLTIVKIADYTVS